MPVKGMTDKANWKPADDDFSWEAHEYRRKMGLLKTTYAQRFEKMIELMRFAEETAAHRATQAIPGYDHEEFRHARFEGSPEDIAELLSPP